MHVFAGYPTDGALPYAGLALRGATNFIYGTTVGGGANADNAACAAYTFYVEGCGTVFRIKIAGAPTLVTLYSFCSCTDDGGNSPYGALTVGATTDAFYGTTSFGGEGGAGTVYKITPAGALTVLHSFLGTDGDNPYDGLVWAPTKKMFYGTTFDGGTHSLGTVFKISPSGVLKTLHSFGGGGGPDGFFSNSGLALGPTGDTFLYGTTCDGGAKGYGTIYRAK